MWLLLALGGCASVGRTGSDAGPTPGAKPDLALHRDGRITLRYPGGRRGVLMTASWPLGQAGESGRVHRTALLEPAERGLDTGAERAAGATPVRLLDAGQWRATMQALVEALAPPPGEGGAMLGVHGRDIVVNRDASGAARTVLHEAKPADLKVVRTVDEQAFAELAIARLRDRYPGEEKLLFETGEREASLVFFELASGRSVLLVRETAPDAEELGQTIGFALRVSDALLLRSHLITPLLRPFSTLGRLAWLAGQSVATLLPRVADADPEEPPPPLSNAAPMDPAAWEEKLDALVGENRYRGAIEPLIDGEAFFTALVQAIQDARESIDIRMYIFDRDEYALRIAELLRRRSQEIRVRIVLDYLGSLAAGQVGGPSVPASAGAAADARGEASIVDILRKDSRIEIRASANPWLTADHAKTIVVDRRLAFVGGMNIGHEYRHAWHDMMVALRGPIVGRLAKDFEQRWAHEGPGGDLALLGSWFASEDFVGAAHAPDYVDLRPLYTRTGDPQILRAQLAAMRAARSRIWVQQAYLADGAVVAELIAARHRGVDVRVVLPSEGDSGFMNGANLVTANALFRNGVRVYAYPGMTHVKAALYDGWACLGSANFDKLSLRINLETNVATSDPRFVARLEQELFERDFARSVPVLEPRPLGWSAYFASFVAGQL